MATRPIYRPVIIGEKPQVRIEDTEFTWFSGLSVQQKQKSIHALHSAGLEKGLGNILEISSKSPDKVGVSLSAFNLMITTKNKRSFTVETAFQSSKVFEKGGPYIDLLDGDSRAAKKDIRLKESGDLIGFVLFKKQFPIEPKTIFYDWLYIKALSQNNDLMELILQYDGFTDIEFNPKKSLNCQAYSAALFVSLVKMGVVDKALSSFEAFSSFLGVEYKSRENLLPVQTKLF
jgi:hypothetical protein